LNFGSTIQTKPQKQSLMSPSITTNSSVGDRKNNKLPPFWSLIFRFCWYVLVVIWKILHPSLNIWLHSLCLWQEEVRFFLSSVHST